MLARMASNFYWLGRYVERTENTARLLEHQLERLVDTAADDLAIGWRVLYRALSQPPPEAPADVDEAEAYLVADAYTLAGGLVEDSTNPASLISCWAMARENACEIRPRLPLRVWVCLNQGFLWLEDTEFHEVETREGVCQDYAHVMASILRGWGVPTRYVSGYLGPDRGDGEGATTGESHAWVEGWFPGRGWIGLDPTNDVQCDERHVRVALGRDYADVPPTRGVFRGSAESVLSTQVRIVRETSSR